MPHAPAQLPAVLALCATHHRSKPRRHPPAPAMLAPRSTTTATTTPHLPTQFHMSPRRQPPINKIQFTRRPHSHDTICRRAVLFSTQQTSPLNHSNTVNCAKRCITKYAPGNPAAAVPHRKARPRQFHYRLCHTASYAPRQPRCRLHPIANHTYPLPFTTVFLRISPPPRRRFPLPRRFFADFSTFPRKIS